MRTAVTVKVVTLTCALLGVAAGLRAQAPGDSVGGPLAVPAATRARHEAQGAFDAHAALEALGHAPPAGKRGVRLPWPPRQRVGVKLDPSAQRARGRRTSAEASPSAVPLVPPGTVAPSPPGAPAGQGLGPQAVLGLQRVRALGLRGSPRAQLSIERWPQEPRSPGAVDRGAFQRAVTALCPPDLPQGLTRHIAAGALAAAAEFDGDPFLLVALAQHQSGCRARSMDSWGVGLTRINLGMFRDALRDGHLRYGRPLDGAGGSFAPAEIPLPAFRLDRATLRDPYQNLRLAAAALRMFREQCRAIDVRFGAVPHRHPVSHLIWGDRVRAALPEAQLLTERRRLLQYYADEAGAAVPTTHAEARVGALPLGSPLDGAPRLVIGLLGDPRDGGRRVHAGIDLPAVVGEPVRAVADGVVTFAGVELRHRGQIDVAPDALAKVNLGRLGKRGIFVHVEHADGLRSMYVHLADYRVRTGQQVRRGEVLGTIGVAGMHHSAAHLHFGLFDDDIPLDPMRHLSPYVLVNPVPLQLPAVTRANVQRHAREKAVRERRRRQRARAATP